MIQLNPVEQAMLDTLIVIRDHFDKSKMGRETFPVVMGQVRKAIARGENKIFGCPQGLHAGRCDCTSSAPGKSLHAG